LPVTAELQRLLRASVQTGLADERFDAMVFDAFGRVSAISLNESRSRAGKRCDLAMLRAKRFIEERHEQAVSVRDIAGHAGLSPFRLVNRFSERYGVTPYAYLLRFRISRAAQLLRFTPLEIGTIAEKSGFSDFSQFSRAFGRIVGQTPREFRRNYRILAREAKPESRNRRVATPSK
jgi:transcriptional regulator GlxA family with amidase domain